MRRAFIKEGEPVAYNPETETVVVKEETDSSVEVFTVNAENGKQLMQQIFLKPLKIGEGKGGLLSNPVLLSGCVQNDGTLNLLVSYEKIGVTSLEVVSDNYYVLYTYEKGNAKKVKKYIFPHEKETEGQESRYFSEEPKHIQCTGGNLYLFSEKNYEKDSLYTDKYYLHSNWYLYRADFGSNGKEAELVPLALIAYDNIWLNYYSEKEKVVYTLTPFVEEGRAVFRITDLNEGYELPEEPVEKENGDFLFSETTDGKPLLFFVKTRSGLEEQRIELLPL